MTNAELIKTLRWCGSEDERHEMCVDESYRCPMWNEDRMTDNCKADLMLAAADALEAADKRIAVLEVLEKSYSWKAYAAFEESIEGYKVRIAELESQLPKEGEWVDLFGHGYKCSVCGGWYRMDGTPEQEDMNYCPNCGARMDGENDADN